MLLTRGKNTTGPAKQEGELQTTPFKKTSGEREIRENQKSEAPSCEESTKTGIEMHAQAKSCSAPPWQKAEKSVREVKGQKTHSVRTSFRIVPGRGWRNSRNCKSNPSRLQRSGKTVLDWKCKTQESPVEQANRKARQRPRGGKLNL